jgi:uncharacterized integral membrane protein
MDYTPLQLIIVGAVVAGLLFVLWFLDRYGM